MRKIAIVFLFAIMVAGGAVAQKTFTFGPKVGVDYTHYWGKETRHGGKLNYQAGFFCEYRFNGKFAIAPEVVFAAQGGKWDLNELSHKRETDHVNYINVPVMLKYYVAPAFSIDFGPQVGFNVYSKYTMLETDGSKWTNDWKVNTNAVDVGVGLGMTYNISDDVFLQGRYTLGVTNAFKDREKRNGNAQIAIGYRF